MKRQNIIKQELDFKFIITDPNKEDLDIIKAINEIFRHIRESIKKT